MQLFGQDPQFARTLTSLDLSRLPKLDDPSMVRSPLQTSRLHACEIALYFGPYTMSRAMRSCAPL
jgi:hypothetical protein